MLVTTIVPRLPPAIDGVGDYALILARKLYEHFGIDSHFIVCDSAWTPTAEPERFRITRIDRRSKQALLPVLLANEASSILMHYVGYGYAKRGCPTWLIEGLEQWKQNNTKQRLVTMFHELFAFGPPWTSAFWLSPLQRHLTTRLARLSNAAITSQNSYALSLLTLSKGKHAGVQVLPVFSNVGEPAIVPPLQSRSRHMIVFGGRSKRIQVYTEFHYELVDACRALDIEKIVDIGALTGLNIQDIDGIPLLELGPCSAIDVSNVLLSSVAGFMVNHPDFLAKSGIFAAYCAHGLLPVNAVGNESATDGLLEGQHYCGASRLHLSVGTHELESVAANALTWYRNHNLDVQGRVFATLLDDR